MLVPPQIWTVREKVYQSLQFSFNAGMEQFISSKKLICSEALTDSPRAILSSSRRLFINDEITLFTFLIDTGADVSRITKSQFV